MVAMVDKSTPTGQVLRSPKISWYLAAYVLDCIGDFMWFVTLGWVAARSSNGLISGLILCSGAVPAAGLMLFGGALIDRFGTARTAIYTMTARALVMIVWTIAIMSSAAPLLVLPILAFVLGCVDGLHRPALETWPTVLAGERAQTTIFGLERLGTRAGQIVGGITAGLLIAHWSIAGPSAVAAAAFIAALLIFCRLARQTVREETVGSVGAAAPSPSLAALAKSGVRDVRQHKVLSRTVPVHSGFNAVTAGLTFTVLPIKAHELQWSATVYGLLFAAWGGGLFLGTIVLLRMVGRIQHKIAMALVFVAAAGCLIIALGAIRSAPAAVVCAGVLGLCGGPVGPSLGGFLRQEAMTTGSRGAIQGVQAFALDGVEPLGFLAAGALVAAAGVLWGCGVLGLALIAAAAWALASRPVRGMTSF